MALSRRTGQRFQANIWPGFVDAMTSLLLVLMFVLTIFTIIQSVLQDMISGQETELNALSGEIAALTQALGLERDRTADLQGQIGTLNATIETARKEADAQAALIASLQNERDAQNVRIASFEEQVASLLAQADVDKAAIASLQGEKAEILSREEALKLALAAAQKTIDKQTADAALAAKQAEAFQALIDSLKKDAADAAAKLAETQANLSEEEKRRLAEAAAAEALRDKLKNSDAELTAMTLALEEQRKKAEETLTLLAAADAARQKAEEAAKLGLTDADKRAALLAEAQKALEDQKNISTEAQRQAAILNQQVAELRKQLLGLQGLLDDAAAKDAAAQVQMQSLGNQLNAALARVATEERRRRELEEAEKERLALEAEEAKNKAKDLEKYRSEFFGRLRDLLGTQEGVRISGDRFVFSSEVLFDTGRAELSGAGRREIAKVANIIRSISNDIPPEIEWILRVDGHTDNVPLSGTGEFRDNWELSQARALSVVRYMVSDLGIAPNRLAANGFGEFQPVNPENTEVARAQNRRIELKFTEK